MKLLRISLVTVLALMAVSSLHADDVGIPMRCKPKEAMDDPKCADILDARFKERNLRLNTRDRVAQMSRDSNSVLDTRRVRKCGMNSRNTVLWYPDSASF